MIKRVWMERKWEHKKYRKENKSRERNVCSCMTGINEKLNKNCQLRNRR